MNAPAAIPSSNGAPDRRRLPRPDALLLYAGIAAFAFAFTRTALEEAAHSRLREGQRAEFRGDAGTAARRYDEACAISPRRAVLRIARADLNARSGRPQEALADLERALALDPGNPSAQRGRGYCLTLLGRTEEAVITFERLLGTDSHERYALERLAGIALAEGRIDDAASYLERLVSSGEKGVLNPPLTLDLARCRLMRGRATDAVELLYRLVRDHPDSIPARAELVRALVAAGRTDDAWRTLEMSSARWPDEPVWRTLRRTVEERRGTDGPR